ncbi:hypothetical protein RFI_07107 [Reticulomyxa filosa]|uniref:Uncharacterized protein n=1 Tax=Reticulomyxa filosa TaxID=46433 RepID=X6NVI3_RETFI|nr:hypothetical protein RFI_07107 [Reticulomyxa filosa]|eukprot:ETO30016.1 hypothetical protein RFI_07107 [Reticulomyxa filosa]
MHILYVFSHQECGVLLTLQTKFTFVFEWRFHEPYYFDFEYFNWIKNVFTLIITLSLVLRKKFNHFFHLASSKKSQKKTAETMTTHGNEKQSFRSVLSEEEETQIIIQYWTRILKIKLGWIQDFNKLVAKYVKPVCLLYSITNIYLLFLQFLQFNTGN